MKPKFRIGDKVRPKWFSQSHKVMGIGFYYIVGNKKWTERIFECELEESKSLRNGQEK